MKYMEDEEAEKYREKYPEDTIDPKDYERYYRRKTPFLSTLYNLVG